MKTGNYLIVFFNGLTGKIINKHKMFNSTEEQAEENLQKSRAWFTYTQGVFCDGYIKKI